MAVKAFGGLFMPGTDRPSPSPPPPEPAAPPEREEWTFGGFTSPNTTSVPDEFFDQLAPRLREAELRVCLYIIRRTFGWKKGSDDISLRQMVEGIRTKDGRQLDLGTGMSKPAVTKAVASLVERRVLVTNRNRSLEKGDEATTYALNINPAASPGVPVLTKLTGGGKPSEHGGVNFVNPQQTVIQETVIQQQGTPVPSASLSQPDPRPRGSDVVVSLVDTEQETSAPAGDRTPEETKQLEEALIKRGVGASTAKVLVRDIRPQLIREKLALFDWAKQHRPQLITRSDGGWLRMAITTNYPLPADFTAPGAREKRQQRESERKAKERQAELEEQAGELARHPSAVAEQRVRVNDRLRDARRKPRLAGAEREAFRVQQEAQHRAAAAEWFVTYPQCAHLKPDWLRAPGDDGGVPPETSWRAPGSFSRRSSGATQLVGHVLAEMPVLLGEDVSTPGAGADDVRPLSRHAGSRRDDEQGGRHRAENTAAEAPHVPAAASEWAEWSSAPPAPNGRGRRPLDGLRDGAPDGEHEAASGGDPPRR